MSKSNTTTAAAAPTAVEVVKEVNAMVQEAVAMVQDAVSAPTDAKPAAPGVSGYYAAIREYLIAKYNRIAEKMPSRAQIGYGALAVAVLVGAFAAYDYAAAPAATEIVANARQAWAPLASADDGTAKMVVAARDGVDRGFDWIMARVGL